MARTPRGQSLPVVLVAIAYIAASGAILAWTLWASRAETIQSARAMLDAFTTVSEDQTGQAIQNVERALDLADAALARLGGDAAETDPGVQVELRRLALNQPLLRWLRVIRADGTPVFASRAHVGVSAPKDIDLLERFRDRTDRGLVFVLPRELPVAWGLELALARPWRHPDGTLAGVIMAALDRDYFERGWTAGSGTSGTSISMFGREGTMLMRSPAQDWAIGRSFADTVLFRDLLPASAEGSYRNKSILDGEERLISYRTLDDYPALVIAVSRRMADVLAPWWHNAVLVSLSWLVTSGAGAATILVLARRNAAGRRRLRKMRQINQQLVSSSVDLILVVSRKGEIVQASPSAQAILGYAPEELTGRLGVEVVVPEDLEKVRAEMRLARRGHVVRNFECRYRHKDGRIVELSWAGRWSEAVQLHFFIGRDMTERKSMENALRQAQKMEVVGQMTGGVAHDFNNLLTVVLGSAELLAGQVTDKPQAKTLVEMIASAAMRGASLTRSLLAFSRKQELEPRATDANALVEGMEPMLRRTLGGHVQVDLNCDAPQPTIMIDPAQLETAILNLALNARDAMPKGGRLTIATATVELDADYAQHNPDAAPGRYVVLTVTDTGIGMPPDVLAQAFEPFFTTKEVGKGSGLGLSMVYGFVKQSNGHVKIYSEPGHGTAVRLYLPCAASPAVPETDEPPDETPASAGETILAVEDDDAVRAYVVGLLGSLGYTVLSAGNAPSALATLRQTPDIDLLFTDVMMPGGMNGVELARQARAIRPGLKVLFTSGYSGDALSHAGKLEPGVEPLTKPYRRNDLATRLRQVLDGRVTLCESA